MDNDEAIRGMKASFDRAKMVRQKYLEECEGELMDTANWQKLEKELEIVCDQLEKVVEQRDEARQAAIIARENPRCPDFEPDCNVCKANKLIDEWEGKE